MTISPLLAAAGLCLALLLPLLPLTAGPVPANKPAHYPDWWFERDVIARLPAFAAHPAPVWPGHYWPTDDFAAANIGQLKYIYSKAAEEFDAVINEGAGTGVTQQVAVWLASPAGGTVRDDFALLNQGQLKATVQPIYRRLRQVGYFGPPLKPSLLYPWSDGTGAEDAFAAVNLGQLKYVFSFFTGTVHFDTYLADGDLDGMADGWELEQNLDPDDAADAESVVGGITNRQRYQLFLDSSPSTGEESSTGLIVYSP